MLKRLIQKDYNVMAHSDTKTLWITSEEEMMAVWSDIVRDITEAVENLNIKDVAKWIQKMLQYNVPGGKKIRGLTLIYAYKMLIPNDQLTDDNIHLARILAWCVELMQAYLLTIDDIMDRSLVRRGKPCWYRCNNIGAAAINDGILIENATYYIVRKYFKGKDNYVNILETFHDVIFKTLMGQCLDMLSNNFGKKPKLDLFTMDRYNCIAEIKTAHYSYLLPITAAMHLAGIKEPEMFRQAKNILLEIGHLYQVQDDYMDCFGDTEVCGKDGNDIQEGKCTWFVVVALQRATPEQRKILEECYGVLDLEKIRRVKQLFIDLNLLEVYFKYEKKNYNLINEHVHQISCGLPQKLFLDLLGQIYRRTS
ncbi:farnesyl pyrophosphate synthase-like isoform X2 [Temnothorax americanus]|uniref:farnesyl pyrophosphate synthase-like isoform X2 n=1 Tax=Temnothorax americanus TaxID=1964332 RepID=UPI00406820BA